MQCNLIWLGFLLGDFGTQRSPVRTKHHIGSGGRMNQWNNSADLLILWDESLGLVKLCACGESPFKGSSGSFQYYPLRQSVSIRKTRIPLWAEKVLGGEDMEDPARMIFKIFNNLYGMNPASHNGLQLLFQYQGHCWFSQPHPWSSTPWPPGLAELLHHSETHGLW